MAEFANAPLSAQLAGLALGALLTAVGFGALAVANPVPKVRRQRKKGLRP